MPTKLGSENRFPKITLRRLAAPWPASAADEVNIRADAAGVGYVDENGDEHYFAETGEDHAHTLDELSDVATAGVADGDVLTYDSGSSSWAPAAPGVGAAGALVLLEQHTASASASLDFTSFISSTYDTYKIELLDIVAASSTADLRVVAGHGGGPTYDTGNNYQWSADGRTSGGAAYTDNGGTGVARLFRDMNTSANFGFGVASLTLYNPQSTSRYKSLLGHAFWTTVTVATGPAAVQASWGVQWYSTAAMTALRFIMSSGNIASGTIRVYGVTK